MEQVMVLVNRDQIRILTYLQVEPVDFAEKSNIGSERNKSQIQVFCPEQVGG
jgi:hypothetical protein